MRVLGCSIFLAASAVAATAATAAPVPPRDPAALRQLADSTSQRVEVRLHRATGVASFVSIEPGALALAGTHTADKATDFLARHGRAFGLTQPASELTLVSTAADRYGRTHRTYDQVYRGVPVFAGRLKLHFDARGELTAANGTIVPGIGLDTRPTRTREEAQERALALVAGALDAQPRPPLALRQTRLVVFLAGLLQGVPGPVHLCWEVEVGNGTDVRERVFVDAHTGKLVERIPLIYHAADRRVHEPDFEDAVIWSEGDPLPYTTGDSANDDQVNGLIDAAAEIYELFSRLSGGAFLSWDGSGGTLHSVWNASWLNCPNASWNGTSTNYCDEVASDDVSAHEWAHAYTESTHGLIYMWQSGALNESYSDIFGELIDQLNGSGTDAPAGVRSAGDCSSFGGDPPPALEIAAPASLVGNYLVAGATFNPDPPEAATAPVALVNAGGANPTLGCNPLVGFAPGRIALVDRGTCSFVMKVKHAQNAGALAVIVADNSAGAPSTMSGNDPTITIPSVLVSQSDGAAIKAALGGGSVVATVELAEGTALSYRWLMGEDATAFANPIRDMWNPRCKADPAHVTDAYYWCSFDDGGGVHTNSGVPNHAFALLVDGGSFNGHVVPAIGATKAAHLYWRAMTVYQHPASDFADHAAALAQSCSDLLGTGLADLVTGGPSGQSLTPADCAAVDEAIAAVELDAEPPCGFAPLLAPEVPPPACGAVAFEEDFAGDPAASWERSNAGVFAEYVPRDWTWATDVPVGGAGPAAFADDNPAIGNCVEGEDDQSRVMHLTSPPIALGGTPLLVFEHYVATEYRFDGGVLAVSVNDGPWEPVDRLEFLHNAYNAALRDQVDNTNPLAGEQAFTGSDGGEVTGSWGQSQVDLSDHASAGDVIRLRFSFGTDGCNGLHGWYVDDVRVCTDEAGAGSVPDGTAQGTPLRAALSGGSLTLTWDGSCAAGDEDYALYEGSLGDFAGHVPVTCSTSGVTSHTFSPGAGDRFYLVVPRSASREGSYGTDSAGVERPASVNACLPRALAPDCP